MRTVLRLVLANVYVKTDFNLVARDVEHKNNESVQTTLHYIKTRLGSPIVTLRMPPPSRPRKSTDSAMTMKPTIVPLRRSVSIRQKPVRVNPKLGIPGDSMLAKDGKDEDGGKAVNEGNEKDNIVV